MGEIIHWDEANWVESEGLEEEKWEKLTKEEKRRMIEIATAVNQLADEWHEILEAARARDWQMFGVEAFGQ